MFVGIVCGFVLFGIALIALRDKIFYLIFGRSITNISDVIHDFKNVADALRSGNGNIATERAELALIDTFLFYSRGKVLKWGLGSLIGIIIGVAGISGSFLLFEQNKKLSEQTILLALQNEKSDIQNAIASLGMVDVIRSRLSKPKPKSIFDHKDSGLQFHVDGDCSIVSSKGIKLWETSNPSQIDAVVALAKSKEIGDQVVAALIHLTQDENQSVVLGALISLERAGKINLIEEISVSKVAAFLEIPSYAGLIRIFDSIVNGFLCDKCRIMLYRSQITMLSKEVTLSEVSGSIVNNSTHIFNRDKDIFKEVTVRTGHSFPNIFIGPGFRFEGDKYPFDLTSSVMDQSHFVHLMVNPDPKKNCSAAKKFTMNNRYFDYLEQDREKIVDPSK